MKVIDLLVKIANGEEVPKKIKFHNILYEYKEVYRKYFREDTTGETFEDDWHISAILNDEIEILVDAPKEDKKIKDKARFQYSQIPSWFDTKEVIRVVNNNFERHQQALNEIIDKINKDTN